MMMWRRSQSKKRFNKSEQSLSDMLLMSDLRFDIFVLIFLIFQKSVLNIILCDQMCF